VEGAFQENACGDPVVREPFCEGGAEDGDEDGELGGSDEVFRGGELAFFTGFFQPAGTGLFGLLSFGAAQEATLPRIDRDEPG
jgi:hypothetical protein